jgi:probable HAF family extracellular repeat protein
MRASGAIGSGWSLSLGFLVAIGASGTCSASPYKVTEVNPPGWFGFGLLNDVGQVAGTFTQPNNPGSADTYSYFYDSNPGGKVVLTGVTSPGGDDPGSYNYASRIVSLNDKGQALGVSAQRGALIIDAATGQSAPIGPIPNPNFAPQRIGDSGAIYGQLRVNTNDGVPIYHAAVYQEGVVTDLGSPPAANPSAPTAINDTGQFLVRAGEHGDQTYLLSNGTWTNLGNFYGQAVNSKGDAVGTTTGDDMHVVLVAHGTTTPVDLGTLPGQTTSIPFGINNNGEIVGTAFTQNSSDQYRAFLYRDGVMTDLNSLIDGSSGWVIRMGLAVNDRGQILATADGGKMLLLTPDGVATSDFDFPAMPVPEPSTYLIFAAAAALAWKRARS